MRTYVNFSRTAALKDARHLSVCQPHTSSGVWLRGICPCFGKPNKGIFCGFSVKSITADTKSMWLKVTEQSSITELSHLN